MDLFIPLLVSLALSVLVGLLASKKFDRSGFGFFVLSCLLSPILGIIILMLMGKKDANKPNPSTHVKCPDCRELVLKDARVCKHCGCKLIPQ